VRRSLLAVLAGVVLAVGAGAAAATVSKRPSDLSCLHEWNLRANAANQQQLLGERPFRLLSLGAATIFVDTPPNHSQSWAACVLTAQKRGRERTVQGRWRDGGVSRWNWGRWYPAKIQSPANVTLLAGGRLKKISRR
jgi:hypothetical protein